MSCTFNLDNLPVAFATAMPKNSDGTYDRKPLINAVRDIANEIWKIGGFRFRRNGAHWDQLRFDYICCQDADHERASVAKGIQDSPRMERFECGSKLILQPMLEQRTLEISIYHRYHAQYSDRRLSPEVMDFIMGRMDSTPAEIFKELQTTRPIGWQDASEHQIYYQWHLANASKWQRDPDPLCSARNLLSERLDVTSSEYIVDNVRALGFYINDSIRELALRAKELAMDATFGTNNAGMQLFAVLAEVDGTGVPLAYCFLEVFANNAKGERRAMPGAISGVLCQFLRYLKASGLNPTFFGTDKDPSEIFAVRQTWPNATVQLCYWHARRAIRSKLASTQKTNTQNEYRPGEAQMIIPDLEICWGSISIRRPSGPHRYGGCSCPSRPEFSEFPHIGRMETKEPEEKEAVINLYSNHFNMHPLIPDGDGIYRSAQQIYRDCALEMYAWCRSKNHFRLWAYMWVNWYHPDQWHLWARSANDKEIPILKTTMIVESHWRKLKHDYLHRFNRPRIDLVIWVLLTRSIPSCLTRMHALLQKNHRRAMASWRKAFKHEWKKLSARSQTIENPSQRYHTNPAQWSCGCPYFVNSRFLMCKHLIFFYEPISDPVVFFREVQRQRSSPFWTHPKQLILKPEYRRLAMDDELSPDLDKSRDLEILDESVLDSDTEEPEEDIHPEAINEDQLVSDSEEEIERELSANSDESDSDDKIRKRRMFVSNARKWADLIEAEEANGNYKFVEKVMATSKGVDALMDDISTLQRQKTMPRTWAPWKHPASMYLRR